MAEKRKEAKVYNAEEQAEITRIIAKLPGSPGAEKAVTPPLPTPVVQPEETEQDFLTELPMDENADLTLDELPDDFDIPGASDDVTEDLSEESEFMPRSFDLDEPLEDETQGGAIDEEPQDITSLLEELPDENLQTFDEQMTESAAEEDFSSVDISGVELPPLEQEEVQKPRFSYTPKSLPKKDPTLAQLETILRGEPETIDIQEYSKEGFYQDDEGEEEAPAAPSAPEPGNTAEAPFDISAEDIPDLSSLSIESPHEMESANVSDLPDLDVADFGLESPENEAGESIADEIGDFDIQDAGFDDDGISATSLDEVDLTPQSDTHEDSSFEDAQMDVLPDIDDSLPEIEIEPDDGEDEDTAGTSGARKGSASGDASELTPEELKKMKKSLLLYAPGLTEAIKDTILNDRLSAADTRRLVELIVQGRPEDNIHRFLEKKLSRRIDPQGSGHRKVLLARPEYSQEGRERQRRLINLTRIGLAGTLTLVALMILGWQYLYKPFMAGKKIDQGVRLIRRDADPKFPDYKEAENIFAYVDKHYVKDYVPGYNKYARAYFDKKEYMRALDKLNKAYLLAEKDKFYSDKSFDTLLGLGYFYSRKKSADFDKFFNESVKQNLNNYYFQKIPPVVEINSQYDLAYNFYRMVLNKRPKSIDALLGIGNIYMNQGEFLKAREFYEEILKIDKDSVAGNAGLLNLFIERDEFTEAITIYVRLRDKKGLKELPSPLLAKLSNYLLSKSRSDTSNIRVDFGIQSPRLKDNDDQPFPAVIEVLKALREKDPDYPPLYVQYAKLSIKQKNYMLAKQYLENGLERSKKQKFTFFAGNQMLGEFYYYMHKADLAYRYLKQAASDYDNPPPYVSDDFYFETEHPGRTRAMIGNIFYYFFDQVTFRTGDQESQSDVEMRANADKMENYNIARNYYEQALQLGYGPNEVHYNLGRIYYLNMEYSRALDQWLNLYDSFVDSPELMMGLGNVFYKLGNYDSAKAQFMKLIAVYEFEAEKIRNVVVGNTGHVKMFKTLSAAYNNLGAVHQVQDQTEQGIVCFWNAIKYAQRLNEENEFARTNANRDFKDRTDGTLPILDDNIPYSIEYFREDMRTDQ